MSQHLIYYILSFVGIWLGAGLAIRSVERVSHKLKLSSFSVSFLLLGMLTSIGEFSVGVNAIIENDPEIYVGNLIGASIVIFMLIIPLLALLGRGIKVHKELQGPNMIMSLIVIAAPVILSIDGVINRFDSICIIMLYGLLAIRIRSQKGVFEQLREMTTMRPFKSFHAIREVGKILLGLTILFISSHVVVEQTLYFSSFLGVSPFLLSLLLISIGTNIPELSLALRSSFMKDNEVAFGDYVGSAAFNSFLVGALTLWYGQPVILTNSYLVSLLFLIVGLLAFYFFAKSKHVISRVEGLLLLVLYGMFLWSEIALHTWRMGP